MNLHIENALINIAQERGMSDVSIDNSITDGKGQGYLSDIIVVNLKGKTKTGENANISFVIKTAGTNDVLRKRCVVAKIFEREIYMYERVFPEFYHFEKERGITNPFCSIPKCFKIFKDPKPEILILEDLKENGYQCWNRELQMEHDHVKVVLEEYGRFHAIAFAMRDQNLNLFQKLTGNLDNILVTWLETSGFFNIFVNKAKQVLTLLDQKRDAQIYKKYQEFLCGIEEKFKYLIYEYDCDNHFCAILHGDCWSNNMLFKYEDGSNNTQPSEIRLIDFQLSKLGSPVFDLVYFFYICTTKQILKDINKYKLIYYNSFSKHLRLLGSNAESLYPFSVFDGHWKKYSVYGLILCSLVNRTLLCQENEIINFAEIIVNGGELSEAFDNDIAKIDEYKERMRCVIEHFVENNFI